MTAVCAFVCPSRLQGVGGGPRSRVVVVGMVHVSMLMGSGLPSMFNHIRMQESYLKCAYYCMAHYITCLQRTLTGLAVQSAHNSAPECFCSYHSTRSLTVR